VSVTQAGRLSSGCLQLLEFEIVPGNLVEFT